MKNKRLSFFNIAALYIGTIMGAGFASGREITDYFLLFGDKWKAGMLLSGMLFLIVSTAVTDIINQNGIKTYSEYLDVVMGGKSAVFTEWVSGLFFFVMFFAMTAAAHDAGLSVMAHVNGAQAVMDAAEAGVDSVEHGNFQNEESICCMAEHATIWVPTIVTVSNLLENGRYPAETLAWIFETQKKGLQLAFEKDVVLAAGSDAGAYGVLHGKGIREEESVMRKILGAENGQELEKRLAFGEKKIREKF